MNNNKGEQSPLLLTNGGFEFFLKKESVIRKVVYKRAKERMKEDNDTVTESSSVPIIMEKHGRFGHVAAARLYNYPSTRRGATITWDGCNDIGNKIPSGFYFLRLEAKGNIKTRKLLLLR